MRNGVGLTVLVLLVAGFGDRRILAQESPFERGDVPAPLLESRAQRRVDARVVPDQLQLLLQLRDRSVVVLRREAAKEAEVSWRYLRTC